MKKIFVLIACSIAFLSVNAQKEKVELKLSLRDGNVISGTSTSISTVALNTDYGKLDVPIKNVSSIKFGITPDAGNKGKVINLVKQLNDATEENRAAAYNELVKLPIGVIPVLSDYLLSNDYTESEYTDYTGDAALNDLKSTFGVDAYEEKDVITIDYEYTMGGSFAIKTISLKTEYGVLEVPKEKIVDVEVSYTNTESGDKVYKLMASKHISSNDNGGWLNTGINVKSGQKINITASGEVTLESLSGNKYTPDGSKTDSNDYESDYESDYPSYGNVVYKVGKDGTSHKAGSKFTGTAKESGVIFLSIYETVYNAENKGSYSVKLTVK